MVRDIAHGGCVSNVFCEERVTSVSFRTARRSRSTSQSAVNQWILLLEYERHRVRIVQASGDPVLCHASKSGDSIGFLEGVSYGHSSTDRITWSRYKLADPSDPRN